VWERYSIAPELLRISFKTNNTSYDAVWADAGVRNHARPIPHVGAFANPVGGPQRTGSWLGPPMGLAQ